MSRLVTRLQHALGENFVEHFNLRMEGAQLAWSIRPPDRDLLSKALAICHEERAGLLIRGGGTEQSCANFPCKAMGLLETNSLLGQQEIDLEDGVARLPAGASVAKLKSELQGTGLELPLDSSGPRATIGGVLASGREGFRHGRLRDIILGMEVVLASGERTHFGGRVVKNVTGYDLNKLLIGSLGSLGVITSAWFRLRPAPECVSYWQLPSEGISADRILELCRLASVRAAVGLHDEKNNIYDVELGGDEASTKQDAEKWRAAGAIKTDAERMRAIELQRWSGDFRARLSVLPTSYMDAVNLFRSVGARILGEPARGRLRIFFEEDQVASETTLSKVWSALQRISREGHGHFVIETASESVRSGRELFDDLGQSLPLQIAIKDRYDPHQILNPGRFVGRR